MSEEQQRQEMIAAARDYLDIVTALLDDSNNRMKTEVKVRLTLSETKVTWLERLAAMMSVNATRRMAGDTVELVFADTDGDAVIDKESGEPSVIFSSFDDISRMVISIPKEKTN